jgi:hypothetical protein
MAALFLMCALIIESAGDAVPDSVEEPALRNELLQREKIDQDARDAWTQWMRIHGMTGVIQTADLNDEQRAEYEKTEASVKDADATNLQWLKELVGKQGWPSISAVGRDGADAAWLLVQHADADPKFQRKCLDLMTRLPPGQVSKTRLAYLTDRVLLAEGKKQVYGTQFTHSDGKWLPRPLEDEKSVDSRRAEAGLAPLADYIRQLEKVYGADAAK